MTTSYSVSVPLATTNVSLTATLAVPDNAQLRINGVLATSGVAFDVVLAGKPTLIVVEVQGTSGTATYRVLVSRNLLVDSPYTPQTYFKASNTEADDAFASFVGRSIAISADGTTLAVGAPDEDSAATGVDGAQADNTATFSGAVYVFTSSNGVWTQQAYLKPSVTKRLMNFGTAVALSANGDSLAVGASWEDSGSTGVNGDPYDTSATESGAVYVFARTNGTWAQEAYVKASNTDIGDQFGHAVALSGDGNTLAVGAYGEGSGATGINGNQLDNSEGDSGAVYAFTRAGGVWTQEAYVKASNSRMGFDFGRDLALSSDGNTLAVGARDEGSDSKGIDGDPWNLSAYKAGAVYVFTRASGVWTQQAYVKASNTDAGDRFGTVALSGDGDTLAVGAVFEASSARGVYGDETSNWLPNSGAVYVFTRANGIWTQQAYMKSSNADFGDVFGFSLGLSMDGNTLVVGAFWEDGASSGVGGNQTSNALTDSGAAYVFTRANGAWAQTEYLKAFNPGANDQFGGTVAISGDGNMVVVGAMWEDSAATGVDGPQSNESARDSGAAYLFVR